MYRYRVTVEALHGKTSERPDEHQIAKFEAQNHDDLFAIVDAVRAKQIVDEDTSAALAIGLKLFSEVALEHRHKALFAEIWPALQHFIRDLKAIPPVEESARNSESR
jgi:hypothetical protein